METNKSRDYKNIRSAGHRVVAVDGLGPLPAHRRVAHRWTEVQSGSSDVAAIAGAGNADMSLDWSNTQRPASDTAASKARQTLPGESQAAPENLYFPLPVYEAPTRARHIVRKSNAKKVLLKSAGLLLLTILLGAGFLTWRGYANVHKVFQGTGTVAALATDKVAPDLLNGEGDGRVNILLLGVGGAGHDGPDLTDTIIVLSVDPVNNTAALVSIPRDLWVKMPVAYFGAYQKINAAYSAAKYSYIGRVDPSMTNHKAVEAGFTALDQVVSEVLGININYHLLVDFSAFKQAIDTVNGVTVDVQTPLYDPTMAWENNNNPLLAAAGVQVMDGKEALLYARSRHTSSDFARSERQRQILVALKEKVLSLGTLSSPTKIASLMQAFGNNAYSDLSTTGASRLFTIMHRISDKNIESIGLTTPPHNLVTTDRVGDLSVVRPRAGFDNYSDIQTYIRSQLKDGYLVKENAPTVIYAPTQAQADAQAETLKQLGYNVTGSHVLPKPISATEVVDLSGGTASYTRNYLEKRYQTQAISSMPVGFDVPEGTQFAILVQ